MDSGAGEPAGLVDAGHAVVVQPATVPAHADADRPDRAERAERLDVAGRLPQAAVLVEVAAHELGRAVVVGVEDGGRRVVDLGPAGGEHVLAERLVLGVVDLPEAKLLPAAAGVGGVDVGEEHRPLGSLDDGPPVGREAGEELGQLAGDHRARLRPRQVGTVRGADPGIERERLAVGGKPAREGRRVLGEEAD